MARAAFDDYLKEILHQRAIWEKKPVVRKMYHHRYEKVVRALSPLRPVRKKILAAGTACDNLGCSGIDPAARRKHGAQSRLTAPLPT